MILESPSLSFKKSRAEVQVIKAPRERPSVSWFCGSELVWKNSGNFETADLSVSFPRTVKVANGAKTLSTPEHISPVFLLWPNLSFSVTVPPETPEVPLLDGSAVEWFCALRRLAGVPQELEFYDVAEPFKMDFGFGFCEARPAETFEVEYSMERGVYRDDCSLEIHSPEDLFILFCARTFIFEEDYEAAKKAGLLLGADAASGVLLRRFGGSKVQVLSGGTLRFLQEPLYHKVLDFLGDLSLFSRALPRCKFRIHNGGHAIHHQIFQRLVQNVTSRNSAEVN